MKLFKKFGLITALIASLSLTACGGDNPNEDVSASSNPTCKLNANWAKISKGLTESKVISILGNPTQISTTSTAKTFIYERCRAFLVQSDPKDDTTQKIEYYGGTVVFTSAVNGYVASFSSPASAKDNVLKEYAPNEF